MTWNSGNELHDIGSLTPYALQARYPGFWGEITDSDLGEAVALAEFGVESNLEKDDYLLGLENLRRVWQSFSSSIV